MYPSIPTQSIRLLWSAFDPVVLTQRDDPKAERALDQAQLRSMLTALLVPPPDPQERRFLSIFASERLRRFRTRIEYPLLLAAAGVARFEARLIREADCAAAIEDEWRSYRENCCGPHDITASLDLLEQAYSWSDRLATAFCPDLPQRAHLQLHPRRSGGVPRPQRLHVPGRANWNSRSPSS